MNEETRLDRLRRMLVDAEETVRLLAKEIEKIEDDVRWDAMEAEEAHGEELRVALLPAGVRRSPALHTIPKIERFTA